MMIAGVAGAVVVLSHCDLVTHKWIYIWIFLRMTTNGQWANDYEWLRMTSNDFTSTTSKDYELLQHDYEWICMNRMTMNEWMKMTKCNKCKNEYKNENAKLAGIDIIIKMMTKRDNNILDDNI